MKSQIIIAVIGGLAVIFAAAVGTTWFNDLFVYRAPPQEQIQKVRIEFPAGKYADSVAGKGCLQNKDAEIHKVEIIESNGCVDKRGEKICGVVAFEGTENKLAIDGNCIHGSIAHVDGKENDGTMASIRGRQFRGGHILVNATYTTKN